MKRKIKLKYYIIRWDWNENKVVKYNILGDDLIEDIYKKVKNKKIQDSNELKNYLDREFKYYYWSKAEAEMIVSDLMERHGEKIDMYRLIADNLDLLTEYINNKMQLNLK